jgi:hypothetical protein
MSEVAQTDVDQCTPTNEAVDEAAESSGPQSDVRYKIRSVCGLITPDRYASMLYFRVPADCGDEVEED